MHDTNMADQQERHHQDTTAGGTTNLLAAGVLFGAGAIPLTIAVTAGILFLLRPGMASGITALVSTAVALLFLGGGISAITGRKLIGRRTKDWRT